MSLKIVVTGTRGIPGIMGGVETHCENLFPRIARLGADVTVVRRSSYAAGSAVPGASAAGSNGAHGCPDAVCAEWEGVKLVDIPTPRRKALEAIWHTFRAVNYAARVKADVVHIHAIGPALMVPYARLRGLHVVFTHHGFDYDRQKWGRLAKSALRLGERFGCRWADEVIVISDVIRDTIARKYGRTEHVSLIFNGVPAPSRTDLPDYFASLGIERGKYVLGMSRFVPEKRLDDLVEAFSRSGLAGRGYRLVLAGDADFKDEYSEKLKALAAGSGAVLTGFVRGDKLHALLDGAAFFVLPSSHEGLPIALLEAMSYGLPVLVSDIPANLAVGLPQDRYYHLGDIDALAAGMNDVVCKSPLRIEYDMSAYDWDSIAGRIMEIYRRWE